MNVGIIQEGARIRKDFTKEASDLEKKSMLAEESSYEKKKANKSMTYSGSCDKSICWSTYCMRWEWVRKKSNTLVGIVWSQTEK